MSQFKVKAEKLREIAELEKTYTSELNNYISSVNQVYGSLTFQVSASSNIRNRLKKVSNTISQESITMKKLQQGLSTIADCYEKTENKICNASKDGEISFKEYTESFVDEITGGGASWFRSHIPVIGPAVCVLDFLISSEKEANFSSADPTSFNKSLSDATEGLGDNIKDKFHIPEKKEKNKQGYWENGQYHEVNQDSETEKQQFEDRKLNKAATFIQAEAKKEASLWSADGEIKGKYGELSGEVKLANGEIHANAYAGLYSTGPDGEKKFTPGVGGEIGGSVTAFSAEGKALLGNDDLGVYTKGEINALKAEAKLGGDFGLFKDGKFNPQAGIGASAEAILIEGTAAVGAQVLGTDVSGNVGVNVGVGAHAEIGLQDGKISFDVGASLGIGVSVELEIDFSGTMDKVGTLVSNCTSLIGNLIQ